MKISAFHATTPDRADRILFEGFRLDAGHKSDSGDFGEAAYFTTCTARAKAIGRVVLEVDLELSNPLTLPQDEAYALVIDTLGFDTIHGHGVPGASIEEAKKAREHFLALGNDALISRRGPRDLEIAVYDLGAIRAVRVFRGIPAIHGKLRDEFEAFKKAASEKSSPGKTKAAAEAK